MAYVYLGQYKETEVAVKTTRGLAGLSLCTATLDGESQNGISANPTSRHEENTATMSSATNDGGKATFLTQASPKVWKPKTPCGSVSSGEAAELQDDELYRLACEVRCFAMATMSALASFKTWFPV